MTQSLKEKKPKLDERESALYMKIVQYGTMDDMFDFAYQKGRADLAEENLKKFDEFNNL